MYSDMIVTLLTYVLVFSAVTVTIKVDSLDHRVIYVSGWDSIEL